jgi:hypothetical protein
MAKFGGTKGWVAAAGVALLMAFVAVPALSGAANAAPVTSAVPANTSTQWAYGGQGWSNNTLQYGNVTITWDASFGWTVVFTVTPTAPDTWMLEEQRTVGITIAATYSGPILHATYNYHGQEADVAFANLTNQSTVYVGGNPVPALGIDNASASLSGAISEAVTKTIGGHTASASLDVKGAAQLSTSFNPALGLIPLNLTGVNQWNSSAMASPSAAWNVSYSWADQGYNGTMGSGSGYKAGSLSGTGEVNLTGYKLHLEPPVFHDGKDRTAIVLVVQGVFDNYDGFIFVPHDFDMFGTAAHDYDSASFGSAAISAETLFVSSGPGGPSVTAASSTYGADDQSVNALAAPTSQTGTFGAASAPSPSGTVVGQPMSPSAAYAEANCLTNGCGGAAAAGMGGALLAAFVGVAVALVVGTVGVIEWRSYARRRSQTGLVGGYGESWPNGVPPAAARSPPTLAPASGKNPEDDVIRQP